MTIALALLLALTVGCSGDINLAYTNALYSRVNSDIDSSVFDVMLRIYAKEKRLTMAYTCNGSTYGAFEDDFFIKRGRICLNSSNTGDVKYQNFVTDFGERCPSLRRKPSWPDLAEFFPSPQVLPLFNRYVTMEFYVGGCKLVLFLALDVRG
ncbi:hypothetical protein FOL47_007258 [Perkinsus chesapeaki]|uniref:Uncharacterized protein n=1 Tax=Perkinsus chesapeaki TaxID=330153 RepID=A0A7J6LLT3_PERCH|nr:hypothetical protein FOL47_007258 [Perkinsus chesapeaki]